MGGVSKERKLETDAERSRQEGWTHPWMKCAFSMMVLGHHPTTRANAQEGSKQATEQWHSVPQNTAGR